MSLANIIALVSSHNADPTTTPDHIEPEAPTVLSVVRNASTKVKASKSAEPIHNPNAGKSMAPGITLPERNTLDAAGFLLAVRNAGKRKTAEGKPFFDKSQERNDLICAIHAFVGYDNRRDFGSQEIEARSKAQRDLRGAPKVVEQTSPVRSGMGFVAGMPKPAQRIVLNLQARERAAVEAMLDAKTDADRAMHKAVLDQIQTALKEMDF